MLTGKIVMSRYGDGDLEVFKSAPPESKIGVLRMEMIPLIETIRGYTDLIKYHMESSPQERELWAQKIIEAVDDLEQLRQILIDDSK
jgi:hypothetical protein